MYRVVAIQNRSKIYQIHHMSYLFITRMTSLVLLFSENTMFSNVEQKFTLQTLKARYYLNLEIQLNL